MTRFSVTAITLAFLVAVMSFAQHGTFAQDVTITITKKGSEPDSKPPFTGTRPAVDVAILLDTSNSMDGLIAQAKSQLWSIVQQFADAKKAGKTPNLRVSVFEYGNTNLPASEGYIRQVVQLTDDLDKVSEVLFALNTNGGDEYCGQVIEQAIKRLDWSGEPNSYKAIFIAGNEPFSQGSVNYKDSCKTGNRKRHRRQHDPLWRLRNRNPNRLERWCRLGRRELLEHQSRSQGRPHRMPSRQNHHSAE